MEMDDNVFTVRVDGHPVYIYFKGDVGRRVVRALKGKDNYVLGGFLKGANVLSNFFSALYTVWNVDFIFTNFIRDVISGALNLKTDGIKEGTWKGILNPREMSQNARVMYDLATTTRAGKLGIKLLSEGDQVRFRQTFSRIKNNRAVSYTHLRAHET